MRLQVTHASSRQENGNISGACIAGNPAEAAADAPLAVEATGAADVKFEPADHSIFWCGSCTDQSGERRFVTAHSLTSNAYASGYHRRNIRHANCWVLGPPPCRAQPPACSTVHRTCAAEIYSLHRMKQLHCVLTGSGRCPLGRAATSSARRLAATMCPAGRSRCTWRLGCPTRSTAGLPARRSRLDPDPLTLLMLLLLVPASRTAAGGPPSSWYRAGRC
jgi:hypothetical protein